MDLTDLDTVKSLLSRYHLRPKDQLGQNFLVDRAALDNIVAAAELEKTDTVLEIGPGLGALTAALAERAGRVLAVEKDKKFIEPLKFLLKGFSNTTIINDDILKFNLLKALDLEDQGPRTKGQKTSFKVVANIPYNITGQIIRLLMTAPLRPQSIVLLVQKEVAERIVAGPGQMSILALSVQLYGQPEIAGFVLKDSFYPRPEVDSAILKIAVSARPVVDLPEKKLFQIAKIGFAAKRKTLANNLAAGFHISKSAAQLALQASAIPLAVRAQELSLEDWQKLSVALEPVLNTAQK